MNFEPSEDERMVQSLAEKFVTDRYDVARRRAYLAGDCGYSAENWTLLSELGLIAAPLPAASGGLGLTLGALVAMFTALGKGLVVEPLIENVVVAARLLLAHASPSLLAAQPLLAPWQDGLADGRLRVALAHAEPAARGNARWVETAARSDGDLVRLNGVKNCVPGGVGAAGYIVSARSAGAPSAEQGLDCYLVPAAAPGLVVTPWRTVDGALAAHVACDDVAVPMGNRLSGGIGALDSVMPLANLTRAAEALGIMERLFEDTLDYLRTRSQFNTQLGKFQAIQHRMVEQYAAIEQSRALVNLALVREAEADFSQTVDGARAFIAQASIRLGHEMIQFHGGMGVTDDLAIGQGHKRLVMLSRWPDDALAALDRFAGLAA